MNTHEISPSFIDLKTGLLAVSIVLLMIFLILGKSGSDKSQSSEGLDIEDRVSRPDVIGEGKDSKSPVIVELELPDALIVKTRHKSIYKGVNTGSQTNIFYTQISPDNNNITFNILERNVNAPPSNEYLSTKKINVRYVMGGIKKKVPSYPATTTQIRYNEGVWQ